MKEAFLEHIVNYKKKASTVFGNNLDKVVLFGSYARGDYTKDSDVDVAFFIKSTNDEKYEDDLADVTFDFMYDTTFEPYINPIIITDEEFNRMIDFYPLFQNINKEGIKL